MKIVSNGMGKGTKIYDDDGCDITDKLHVRKATVLIEAGSVNTVLLECVSVELDIEIDEDHTSILRSVEKE